MTTRDIDDFWTWFTRTGAEQLAKVQSGTEPIVRDLDERIEGMGLSWEMGPAPDDPNAWALAISFGGSLKDLPRAQMVVNRSPLIPGWRVLLGKPRKQWDWRFSLPKSDDQWVDFNSAAWLCALEQRTDGRLNIRLSMEPWSHDQDPMAEWAAEIAVQSAIGELAFATHVAELILASPTEVAKSTGRKCLLPQLEIELQTL